jgi:hypothetical protein
MQTGSRPVDSMRDLFLLLTGWGSKFADRRPCEDDAVAP